MPLIMAAACSTGSDEHNEAPAPEPAVDTAAPPPAEADTAAKSKSAPASKVAAGTGSGKPAADATAQPAGNGAEALATAISNLIKSRGGSGSGATGTANPSTSPNPGVAPIDPGSAAGDDGQQFIAILNQQRAARSLPPIAYDANLAARCLAWSKEMAATGFRHDPSVYGTSERENIAYAGSKLNPRQAYTMWEGSPGHNRAMFDNGFPTAVKGGYAQVSGYGCLRLCPANARGSVCK